MLVAVCSAKGSPGATTTAAALAASWPTSAVVVEADEAGSDLAVFARTSRGQPLAETPTVATLAAAARQATADTSIVRSHAQTVGDRLLVVPSVAAHEAAAGMAALWRPLAVALASADTDVIADLGRMHSTSSAIPIAASADVVVIVARAETDGLLHLRTRLGYFRTALADGGRMPALMPLLVTRTRTAVADTNEVDEVLAAERIGAAACSYVSWDRQAASQLLGGYPVAGRLAKSALLRSGQQAADQVAGHKHIRQEVR